MLVSREVISVSLSHGVGAPPCHQDVMPVLLGCGVSVVRMRCWCQCRQDAVLVSVSLGYGVGVGVIGMRCQCWCCQDVVLVLVLSGRSVSVGVVGMWYWHRCRQEAVSALKLWMLRDLQCQQLRTARPTLPTQCTPPEHPQNAPKACAGCCPLHQKWVT